MIKPKYYIFPPYPHTKWLPYAVIGVLVLLVLFLSGYAYETDKLMEHCASSN